MYVFPLSPTRYRSHLQLDLPTFQKKKKAVDYLYRGSYCEINARSLKAQEVSSAIRMLIRLVVLHQHGGLTDNQWQAVLALTSHKAWIEQSKELDWKAIRADIRLVKEVTKDDLSENDLEDLYWRVNITFFEPRIVSVWRTNALTFRQIKINEHSLDSPMQPRLGSCLVPGAALINHSCSPNAHHLSEGPELVLRSCRKIAKNEEITISYIDPTQSFEERQKALSTAYAFDCQCCRCTESQLDALLHALVDDGQELSSVDARTQETYNSLSSGKPWPISISPIPTIYVTLATLFEEKQRWEEALRRWLKIVYVIGPLRYPERLNLHRVEDLMSLCQLEARISHESETDSAVEATFHRIELIMSIVHYGHNTQLKEDAAASLGANHIISKVAAYYVKALDEQTMTSMGVTPSDWQSAPVKKMREERFKLRERELLEWAGIDLTAKVM
ncbi:MAG: hypothetical protein Q9175_008012 [Cornicularia normoerica]